MTAINATLTPAGVGTAKQAAAPLPKSEEMGRGAFVPVDYMALNARQKELYNFYKISARLADYGFHSMWFSDDWQGADFLACHIDGMTVLRVQLKARMTIDKKYLGKGQHIRLSRQQADFHVSS